MHDLPGIESDGSYMTPDPSFPGQNPKDSTPLPITRGRIFDHRDGMSELKEFEKMSDPLRERAEKIVDVSFRGLLGNKTADGLVKLIYQNLVQVWAETAKAVYDDYRKEDIAQVRAEALEQHLKDCEPALQQARAKERRYWQEFMKINHFEDHSEARAEGYEAGRKAALDEQKCKTCGCSYERCCCNPVREMEAYESGARDMRERAASVAEKSVSCGMDICSVAVSESIISLPLRVKEEK